MKKLIDYLNEQVEDGRLGTVDLPTPEKVPVKDIGFLCNCEWEPGHDCAEARKPTNAPTSAKEK